MTTKPELEVYHNPKASTNQAQYARRRIYNPYSATVEMSPNAT